MDRDELKRRYDLALERENPTISHTLKLQPGKYLSMDLAGTKVLLASIPLAWSLGALHLPGLGG